VLILAQPSRRRIQRITELVNDLDRDQCMIHRLDISETPYLVTFRPDPAALTICRRSESRRGDQGPLAHAFGG
jgi:hypothetical protein